MLYELPVKSNGPVRVARLLVTFVAALAALFLALMAETAVAAINSHETSRNSNADGGASTLTVNKPANIAAGNFLMAQVTFEKGTEITIDLSQLDIVAPHGVGPGRAA